MPPKLPIGPAVLIYDPAGRPAVFDSLFRVPVSQEVEHAEAHEKDAFAAGFADISMANAETIIIAFKTPPGSKRVHLLLSVDCLIGCHINVYKNSTWDAESGTLLPIYNRFQEVTPEPSGVLENQAQPGFAASGNMILNPTTHVVGDKIKPTLFSFGAANKIPAGTRGTNENILQVDTPHSIVFTADGNNNKGQIIAIWYEHTDKP